MDNLKEIIELCNEELDNNDENITAILDYTDLKDLRYLINTIEENSILDVDNFIWKLKSDNLYTKELEEFIENYMKFYNKWGYCYENT